MRNHDRFCPKCKKWVNKGSVKKKGFKCPRCMYDFHKDNKKLVI